MFNKVKRTKLDSHLYHLGLCKNNSEATVVKCCQSFEPAVRTQTICLTTTHVVACVVERHHYGGKCTFCQSSHEQNKQRGLTVRGNMKVKEKAMWPFYKVRLRMRGFREERGDTNTCMLHVHPPGPHSGTVTCILEILSPWLLRLFYGPFIFAELSERTGVFLMTLFLYTENVKAVGGR